MKNIIIKVLVLILMISIFIIGILKTTKEVVIERDVQAIAKIKEDPVIVYDDMTIEELTDKLNRLMKANLEGKGELFATHCINMGVDPYIALAIVFQETGCYYGYCSYNVNVCNNIGGMVGGNCNGLYQYFDSIDTGIINFINNLAYGYFYQGLNTPELMNSKYAADPLWAQRVNNYVNIIRNS